MSRFYCVTVHGKPLPASHAPSEGSPSTLMKERSVVFSSECRALCRIRDVSLAYLVFRSGGRQNWQCSRRLHG